MSVEKIETIHDKIQQAQREHCAKFLGGDNKAMPVVKGPAISDAESILQTLQYILDKLHSLDQFVRMGGKVFDRSPFIDASGFKGDPNELKLPGLVFTPVIDDGKTPAPQQGQIVCKTEKPKKCQKT